MDNEDTTSPVAGPVASPVTSKDKTDPADDLVAAVAAMQQRRLEAARASSLFDSRFESTIITQPLTDVQKVTQKFSEFIEFIIRLQSEEITQQVDHNQKLLERAEADLIENRKTKQHSHKKYTLNIKKITNLEKTIQCLQTSNDKLSSRVKALGRAKLRSERAALFHLKTARKLQAQLKQAALERRELEYHLQLAEEKVQRTIANAGRAMKNLLTHSQQPSQSQS